MAAEIIKVELPTDSLSEVSKNNPDVLTSGLLEEIRLEFF